MQFKEVNSEEYRL